MSEETPRVRPPLLPWLVLAVVVVGAVILGVQYHQAASGSLDWNEIGRIATLLLILVFVGAGLFTRQIGAFAVLRSIVAWAAIILLVAGAYASRDELAGFAGRLLGALAPGLPITGRLAGEANPDSVVITRALDGHFGVDATVESTPLMLLVDTGASFVTLTHDDAKKVGIDPDRLDYNVPINTANGTMTAASVVLDRVAVGPIERHILKALVAPRGSLEQSLLGMTFLDTLKGYAISGDRLILTP